MSRGIITPRERKAIIEADESTYGNLVRWSDVAVRAHAFRHLVQGAGTAYDEMCDQIDDGIRRGEELQRLVRKARRDYRALEKHLAKCTPRNDPGPFTAPSAKRKR